MGEGKAFRAHGVSGSEERTSSAVGVNTTAIFEAMADENCVFLMIQYLLYFYTVSVCINHHCCIR
jgi:hypothetical protein